MKNIILFTLLILSFSVLFKVINFRESPNESRNRNKKIVAKVLSSNKGKDLIKVSWQGEKWDAASMDCEKEITPCEEVIVIGKRDKVLTVLPLITMGKSQKSIKEK